MQPPYGLRVYSPPSPLWVCRSAGPGSALWVFPLSLLELLDVGNNQVCQKNRCIAKHSAQTPVHGKGRVFTLSGQRMRKLGLRRKMTCPGHRARLWQPGLEPRC